MIKPEHSSNAILPIEINKVATAGPKSKRKLTALRDSGFLEPVQNQKG